MTSETPNAIPQSDLLTEASPDSLAELLSRDPAGYTRQDLTRVVEAFRAQRERWAKAEAEPKASKGAKATAGKAKAILESKALAADLDL